MNLSRLKLRQKLLILLFSVGGIGLSAYVIVIAFADQQLSDKFIPENRYLRDVESRSTLLLQNHFRFMLTPDMVIADGFEQDLNLIRESLATYTHLTKAEPAKEELAAAIATTIDALETTGNEMIASRRDFTRIFTRQYQLENDIDQVFMQYRAAISVDIGIAIENQNWRELTRDYMPELRMIDNINQLFLALSLKTRKYQIDSGNDLIISEIEALKQRIKSSNAMLELYASSSSIRARLSAQILVIYQDLINIVDEFTMAQKQAGLALARAEQTGIDLNEIMQQAIAASETVGWRDLRLSLFTSGSIIFLTLIIGYLLIYLGLDRILKPLESLQQVIDRLGEGDLKQRSISTGRADEVGLLADAFNRMADELEDNVGQKQRFIDQLEQKNMELEQFSYSISHELKSPLVTMSGFVGLLEKDLAEDNRDRIENDMSRILNAINIMGKQLDDLLELSRVGRITAPPASFSITSLCLEVKEMMQGMINEHNALIEIEDEMPQVHADQARIREVIKNLVENGIKFASVLRRPRITINAEKVEDKIECRVQDNGPGIEPRYQDRVFGLFDRLDTDVSGTGIGLALVKRIIEIHDGDIWIESQGNGR
ncbi:MAG: HAMP domain-containing histidine kinase, partial [Gammaproteobacteria bacterium]|nr:HAMP domain-containing histidine kinase [Gammaproteobacteria bacterium]